MLYGGIPFGFEVWMLLAGALGTLFFALVLYRLIFGWNK